VKLPKKVDEANGKSNTRSFERKLEFCEEKINFPQGGIKSPLQIKGLDRRPPSNKFVQKQ
jgi:hypothetical protein